MRSILEDVSLSLGLLVLTLFLGISLLIGIFLVEGFFYVKAANRQLMPLFVIGNVAGFAALGWLLARELTGLARSPDTPDAWDADSAPPPAHPEAPVGAGTGRAG